MVAAKVMTPRGTANLVFNQNEDAIVDLCIGRQPVPPTERSLMPVPPPGLRVSPFNVDRPDPEDSFLDYQLVLDVQPIDNTIALQPLPTEPVSYAPPTPDVTDQTGYQQPYSNGPCAIVQYRGSPLVYVTLWGRAVRAGYQIAPPQLVSLGGQTPTPSNDSTCGFRSWVAANLGIPIVCAEWLFRYLLPCLPNGAFTAPNNPIYGGPTVALSAIDYGLGFITQG
jgi:hypothetical protein